MHQQRRFDCRTVTCTDENKAKTRILEVFALNKQQPVMALNGDGSTTRSNLRYSGSKAHSPNTNSPSKKYITQRLPHGNRGRLRGSPMGRHAEYRHRGCIRPRDRAENAQLMKEYSLHIYTSGSSIEDRVGSAAFYLETTEVRQACMGTMKTLTAYTGEAYEIFIALRMVLNSDRICPVYIFSDNQSGVKAVPDPKTREVQYTF